MLSWFRVSLLLCFFGFLKEIRPSEPFVSDYLIYPWRNITTEELNKHVWPKGTYATAIQLIIVLLITDFLRYKPIIILCGISGIITYSLLIWTTSLEAAILIQVTYGTYIATEVAYYTYIYAKVDKEHYMKVTSHTRAAILCGKFLSGVLAQTLVFTQLLNLRELNICTLSAQIAATIWAFLLPPVANSLYFNRNSKTAASTSHLPDENNFTCANYEDKLEKIPLQRKCTTAFEIMFSHLQIAYTNPSILLWSFWYAAGMCGHFQVISYVQMLWIDIDNRPEVIWNGAVEACTTLLGASVALLASRLHQNALNQIRMLWILLIFSLLQALGIFIASNTSSRFISYAGYMFFYVLYTFSITISSAEIAKKLPEDSYGLIFGINTFAALVIQSLLTMIVVTDTFGFSFHIRQQFNVYSYFYTILGLIYVIPLVYIYIVPKKSVDLTNIK